MYLKATGVNIVKVGDIVKVILQEQAASTGYRWFITCLPEGMQYIEKKNEPPETDLMGAPNNVIFVFKVLEPGRMTLKFDKLRGWSSSESIETVIYKILSIDS